MFVNTCSVATPYFFTQKNKKENTGYLSEFGNWVFLPVGFSSAGVLSYGVFVVWDYCRVGFLSCRVFVGISRFVRVHVRDKRTSS